ncbi:MAG: 30S ribosomal protein S20 [Defluviitaleaceae bacterium]|nr:30S ribosomal protein S20 [Defluviitaleaceae bacterium]
MANIKSQKKRIITNEKRRQANVSVRTSMRSAVKAVEAAIEAKDVEAAVKAYNNANKRLDKAVSKGIVHKNFAARNKSRLSKKINALQQG